MSGIYYTDMLTILRNAGCVVKENSTTAGWQSRARSSGGFPSAPLCVFWHHTASQTSPENDLAYMIQNSPDRPVGNMLIDRTGACWPVAAGASNCAGKGGPMNFSRGQVPLDSGNTRGWQIEVANNGVGEAWPQVQIDAFFKASNAMNARFGNLPTDITSHALGAGDGYTSRKIDPATAAAVQGPWRPRSTNSSGTWNLADMRSECSRRATPPPDPVPPSVLYPMEDGMQLVRPNKRSYDSRNNNGRPFNANEVRTITIGTEAAYTSAGAAMVNLCAAAPAATGFLKAWTGDNEPLSSVLNFVKGQSIANAVIIPLANGKVKIRASASTHLVVDVQALWNPE